MSVPAVSFSMSSMEKLGEPSQLHFTACEPSRWLSVTMSTRSATMKAE